MSFALLHDVHAELRRLSIAGSALAHDDFRLKKLLPQLLEAGKTVPIFNRLAHLCEQVSLLDQPADAFMKAAILTSALLSTQASNGSEGSLVTFENENSAPQTNTPYKHLKPLLTALTSKGGGRFNVIERGIISGQIEDIRLVAPLIDALDENSAALHALVTPVLKRIAQPFLPRILQRFSAKTKGNGTVCRLDIIAHFLGRDGLALYRTAYDEGAPAVKIKAIEIMANYPECETFLAEASRHKKWEISEAALMALGKMSGATAVDILEEALKKNTYRIAAEGIGHGGVRQQVQTLVLQAYERLDRVREALNNAQTKLGSGTEVDQFFCFLAAIANSGIQSDDIRSLLFKAWEMTRMNPDMSLLSETLPFLKLAPFADDDGTWEQKINFLNIRDNNRFCQVISAKALISLGTHEALDILEADLLNPSMHKASVYFTAKLALKLRDPSSFYETYAPLMESGQNDAQRGGMVELFSRMTDFINRYHTAGGPLENAGIVLDPRWVPIFARWENLPLVALFIRPEDQEAFEYLKKKLDKTMISANHHSSSFFIIYQAMRGLLRIGRADAFAPAFLNWLEVDYLKHFLLQARPTYHTSDIPYTQEVAEILSFFSNQARELLERLHADVARQKPKDLYYIDDLIAAFEGCLRSKKTPQA